MKSPSFISRKGQVLALSLGQALTSLITLLIAIVLVRVLTQESYAAYRQTLLAIAFVMPIAQLGVAQGLFYYLPTEIERFRGRVIDGICVLFFTGGLFALFILLGGNSLLATRFDNPKLEQLLLWMVPYVIILPVASLLPPVLVIQKKARKLSIYNVFSRLAVGSIVITCALIWRNSSGPVIGMAVTGSLGAGVAIYLMVKESSVGNCRPSFSAIKSLISISLPLGATAMVGVLTRSMDKLLVADMCTAAEFAVYVNGAIEIPLIDVVTCSITVVILAEIRKSIVDGKTKNAVNLFRLAAEKSSSILLPAFGFFIVSGGAFIETLFTKNYAGSTAPFLIYLILLPTRAALFGPILISLGLGRAILIRTSVTCLLNLMLSIYLIKQVGPNGAAIATVAVSLLFGFPVSLLLLSNATQIKIRHLLPWEYYAKVILLILPIALIVFVVDFFLLAKPPVFRLICNSCLFWLPVLYWWGSGVVFSWRNLNSRIRTFFKV